MQLNSATDLSTMTVIEYIKRQSVCFGGTFAEMKASFLLEEDGNRSVILQSLKQSLTSKEEGKNEI